MRERARDPQSTSNSSPVASYGSKNTEGLYNLHCLEYETNLRRDLTAAHIQTLQQAREIASLQTQISELKTENAQVLHDLDQLTASAEQHMVVCVDGSSYDRDISAKMQRLILLERENVTLRKGISKTETIRVLENELEAARDALERRQSRDEYVKVAFRMVKYELWAASVDLLGYSIELRGPSRACIVTPAWDLNDPVETFEFIYDQNLKRYTDVKWTPIVKKHINLYVYWVQQRSCVAGFLMAVYLARFEREGIPPPRQQKPS